MRKSTTITVNILAAGLLFAGAAYAQNSTGSQQQPASQPAAAQAAKPSLNPQQAPAAARPAPPAPAQPAETIASINAAGLNDEKAKVSYALGMSIGSGVKAQSIEIDEAAFDKGFRDAAFGPTTVITQEQMGIIINAWKVEMRNKAQEHAKLVADTNKKEGDAFLDANKSKEGVVVLPSGLQYKILAAGAGPKPAATDTVTCNYRGTLIDGTEFDSSAKHGGQPSTFPVTGVIKAWTEALELMPVGSKWQLFVPSDLAYGERGTPGGPIGPNAALVFEVELVSIKEKPQPAQPAPGTTPNGAPKPQ